MKICAESDLLGTVQMEFTQSLPASWPMPAWRGLGFVTPLGASSEFLDVTELPLKSLLITLCPAPSFVDLRKLRSFMREIEFRLGEPVGSIEEIFDLPSEGFVGKLLTWLDEAPLSFWAWCDERSLKWGHIRALALLEPGVPRAWLSDLGRLAASLQQGQRILEWNVELELMGHPPSELAAGSDETLKAWETRLKEMRYPGSEAALRENAERIRAITWPKGVQGKWIRQGDRQVLEVRLQACSKDEYRRQLEHLTSCERSPWT